MVFVAQSVATIVADCEGDAVMAGYQIDRQHLRGIITEDEEKEMLKYLAEHYDV